MTEEVEDLEVKLGGINIQSQYFIIDEDNNVTLNLDDIIRSIVIETVNNIINQPSVVNNTNNQI